MCGKAVMMVTCVFLNRALHSECHVGETEVLMVFARWDCILCVSRHLWEWSHIERLLYCFDLPSYFTATCQTELKEDARAHTQSQFYCKTDMWPCTVHSFTKQVPFCSSDIVCKM